MFAENCMKMKKKGLIGGMRPSPIRSAIECADGGGRNLIKHIATCEGIGACGMVKRIEI